MDLRSIVSEILDDISAVPEEIHDVSEITRVLETQSVAEFVQAREIDDAFTQQGISTGAHCDFGTERIHVRPNENGRALFAANNDRPRFAVFAPARFGPIEPDKSTGF